MKNLHVICLAAVLFIGLSSTGGAQTTGIVGSKHDFTLLSWAPAGGQICVYCHTPHNAVVATGGPLWNRASSTATYSTYSSATMNATVGAPDATSKLCLSCHDGTIAIDNYGGVTTGTHSLTSGASYLGTDLSNDHPISFTYDAALVTADPGLFNPTTTLSGLTGTTGHIDDDMLYSGKVQCTSCHDVHNGSGVAKLLVKSNTGSALCLTCHNK